ncbi:MAG TPA: sodium:solute symporter [Thermoanaerobaculia bacterium]|nr:sodium:solute symporter [Thermoanaerobaculia bacterium]
MRHLPSLDLVVLAVYVAAVIGVSLALSRRSRTPDGFAAAGGALPGWAVGLSLFGTFLSSNTFLGVPGKAFAEDWNSFLFSLTLPLAAWAAVRWFVPFYRRGGALSAYEHLERRFGRWARTYAMVCYLLTQLARVGAILFGMALALGPLTGWRPAPIILATGVLVTVYTLIGGIEAVIWTDVIQSVVLGLGALVALAILVVGMPGGIFEGATRIVEIGAAEGKWSLGSTAPDLTTSTVWVVLLYGLFINLNNFGIDQSYVQRYHTARSERAAGRSVWLAAWLYLPVSGLFFLLGTSLYADLRANPERWRPLVDAVDGAGPAVPQIADRAFPFFIVEALPPGVSGLIVAALFAAAMSSIDTSLNSSATVIESDLFRAYFRPDASETARMRVLRSATVAVGAAGTGAALAMIGVKSLLDAWWLLSGVFAGGLLGLFLLGMIVRRAGRPAALAGVIAGVLVIAWMTLSPRLPDSLAMLRSPLHANMVIVVGTLTLFTVGATVAKLRPARAPEGPR